MRLLPCSAARRALALSVVLLVAAGCGSSGSSSTADPDEPPLEDAAGDAGTDHTGTERVATDDPTFCEVWTVVDTAEGTGDIEADYRFLIGQLEIMAATVPADLATEVDELTALFDADAELLARYDWDHAEVFAAPDAAEDLEQAFERENEIIARLGNGPLARHAFEQCDGVADPRFNLPCAVTRFESIPNPDATTTTTTTTAPMPTGPPDDLADEVLAETEGAVEWVSRPFAAGDGFEYAFVGTDDVPVRIVQFSADSDGWQQTDDLSCEDDDTFVDIGEVIAAD